MDQTMNTFYFVRHAHADWTPEENRSLSARGRNGANRVADALQQYPISAIYSSPFLRAFETITPLAKRLGYAVHPDSELRERQLGNSTPVDFFEAVEATWQNPSFAYPVGESNAAAQQRGLAVLRRLHEQYVKEHLVLSTHGNLMALILQHFDPSVDFLFWRSLTMPDIYTVNLDLAGEAVLSRLWQESWCDEL